jgi:type II secretory pathway pseudopilin PulG
MKLNQQSHNRSAFTLHEMVLALGAMIAIAALMVPALAFNQSFNEEHERSTARLIASVSFQAREAGCDFVVSNNLQPTLQNLLAGGDAPDGRHFQVFGVSPQEAQAAAKHLRIVNGCLTYQRS